MKWIDKIKDWLLNSPGMIIIVPIFILLVFTYLLILVLGAV